MIKEEKKIKKDAKKIQPAKRHTTSNSRIAEKELVKKVDHRRKQILPDEVIEEIDISVARQMEYKRRMDAEVLRYRKEQARAYLKDTSRFIPIFEKEEQVIRRGEEYFVTQCAWDRDITMSGLWRALGGQKTFNNLRIIYPEAIEKLESYVLEYLEETVSDKESAVAGKIFLLKNRFGMRSGDSDEQAKQVELIRKLAEVFTQIKQSGSGIDPNNARYLPDEIDTVSRPKNNQSNTDDEN